MGMLKNTAVEVVEKEHELKASSYQKILHKITKDLLYPFHDLPAEVEDKKDTKKIIEEAIEEKEEAAAEISRKRKQEKRAAKIAACSADAEKSSVARGKRTKSRLDDK